MEITLSNSLNAQRKLCIKKDLIELSQWIDILSMINTELELLKQIEKQLIKNSSVELDLFGFRRNNTLVMGTLCKYEQELKKEYEYGKTTYDVPRAKLHEKKREIYSELIEDHHRLKKTVYNELAKYQRR